jgi:hypothetical protein
MAEKSGYKKLVAEQSRELLAAAEAEYDKDKGEHGGASAEPNFAKWLDRTRKLFSQIDAIAKGWSRAQVEEINHSSRNAVTYGDPRESAYFALYKDVLHEVKKSRKQGA